MGMKIKIDEDLIVAAILTAFLVTVIALVAIQF